MSKRRTPDETKALLSVYRGVRWLRAHDCFQSIGQVANLTKYDQSYLDLKIEEMERSIKNEEPPE